MDDLGEILLKWMIEGYPYFMKLPDVYGLVVDIRL